MEPPKPIKNGRLINVDYLKFAASIIVALTHYYCLYSCCKPKPALNDLSKFIFEYFPKPFFIGNFWVCVFCLLSGVLSTNKEINSFKQLLIKIIQRYLRFFIPIFFTNIVIYIFYKYIGFSNTLYGDLFNNVKISEYLSGDIYFLKVLKLSLLFKDRLNNPLWCIKPIFAGNILLLIRNYLKNKINCLYIYDIFVLVILILLSIHIFEINTIYICLVYIGPLFQRIKEHKPNKIIFLYLFAISIIYTLVYQYLEYEFYLTVYLNAVTSILLVSLFLHMNIRKTLIDGSLLSSLSFWIYLIHYPIICSFSCWSMTLFQNYTVGFWITLTLTFVIILMFSTVLVKYFDKGIKLLTKYIKSKLINLSN